MLPSTSGVPCSRRTSSTTASCASSCERDFTIVEVPLEEYWDLAVNGVTLAPGKVVINRGSPTVVDALERHGVEVIQVDFSESQRFAIAGLHCATLELVRDQPGG